VLTYYSLDWPRAERLSKGSPLTRLAIAHALARSGSRTDAGSARVIVRDIEQRRARRPV